MMKQIIISLLLLSVIGCSSSTDGPADVGTAPVEDSGNDTGGVSVDDSQSTAKPLEWGWAKCQRNSNCDSFILNYSKYQWELVVKKVNSVFHSDLETSWKPIEKRALYCGSKVYREMKDHLTGFGTITDVERAELMVFLNKIFDINECRSYPNLEKNMNAYLNEKLKN